MKAKIIPFLEILTFLSLLFFSCEDTTYKEYKGYAPVYLPFDELRSSVAELPASELTNPGKIYFKDNFIFIVDELSGIHIYDNTDPSAPVNKSFINVPGVIDISVSGTNLYADSYVDLVVIDLQDLDNIHESGRVKDIFPYTVPAYQTDFPTVYVDKEKGVVQKWELKTIKEKVETYRNPYPYPFYNLEFNDAGKYSLSSSSGISGSGIGVGGSMARFGIKDKILYTLDQSSMKVFDITTPVTPVKLNELSPGWNVETMFLRGNEMFLGTTTGMAVFDISTPAYPVSKTFFTHARSCDPVVVDDTIAYITLRSGSRCGGVQNLLEIVNIKDITRPVSLKTYFLTNPYGLGKDGDLIFVCDGSDGLKIYKTIDPKNMELSLIHRYPGMNAFDVIPIGHTLILISENGLFQYDYTDVLNISLLSKINIKGK